MNRDITLIIEAPIGALIVHNRGNIISIKANVNKIIIDGNFNTITIQKSGKINSIIYNGNNNRLILNNNQLIDTINIANHGINNHNSSNNLFFNGQFIYNLNNFFNLMRNNVNSYDSVNDDKKNEEKNRVQLREKLILQLDEFQFQDIHKFIDKKNENLDDVCSICLEKFDIIDIIKKLPCEHIFHKKCLLKWLKESDLCPLCKDDLNEELKKQKEELQKLIK